MSTDPLSTDVYVAPMRPYTCPDQLGEGEEATWAPSSSTLISGPAEGILIDALLTFENADRIAAWAKSSGRKITGVYITHGHSDHWLGLARLLEHLPGRAGTRLRRLRVAPPGRRSSTRPASTGRRASRASSPRRRWCPRC
jgi:glyoxylase-like metal-dependent hydrolase (beta-lactamase superfamily II)